MLPLLCLLRKSTTARNVRPKCYTIKTTKTKKENNPMGNIADEFYDDYYSTICPECKENQCDEFMPMCEHCWLGELADSVTNEDIALEMSLGLDY
jgi:hypothetical protein